MRKQDGGIAPFMVLALGGALLATAYSIETSRMTNSAAQVKRATDAAAMAVGKERLGKGGQPLESLQILASRYVLNNLGMDSELGRQLDSDDIVLTEERSEQARIRYRVAVNFQADAELLGSAPEKIRVHSTVEVQPSALEVVLTLPNSGAESAGNLAVLRRLGKRFANQLIQDREDAWLALVPYSQAVNVSPDYTNPESRTPAGPSSRHMLRLSSWAIPAALRPVELTSLFRSGYSGLHDRRIPDRRANLLCMYRGLNIGENYRWDQAPTGQFRIYYRHDLPENGSPGATAINWIGPNPMFGQANGTNDTRWMVADKGCPSAPLLPLTNDMDKIEERLDQMSTRFNTNYAIAMGWSAMALSPAFRGSNGWGLPDGLPLDFKEDGGDSYKAIVMLVNTTDQRWFDSDAYNTYVAQPLSGSNGTDSLITQRFASLCDSFRRHQLRFYMIAIGQDEIPNNDLGSEGTVVNGASDFRRIAGPGLARCTETGNEITYLPGFDFVAAEGQIQARLDKILEEIRQQGSYVRLVE
ncbi:pilus assembly protein [Pseudomonas sp. ABC1]|nr:pilus assembly protein [Pseudomonas sp. ABC1]